MKHQLSRFRHSCLHSRRVAPAFTLVEMLVVITIITVLLTIGAVGLKNMSKSGGISAGLPVAEAIFAEAKAQAIGSGGTSRFLICSDATNNERYLRYMLITTLQKDISGNEKWVVSSKGSYLPKGVFFSQAFSKLNHAGSAGDIPELPAADQSLYGGVESGTANSNFSGTYFYYEFNGEGIAKDPGASFIIGSGVKRPGTKNPRVTGDGLKNFGGFVVWSKGSTSLFRHPKQMKIPLDIKANDEF
jgi:prepilin-type N-terminal cleavage/methylation domain-containing protein